jgi:hypothetical protein
MRWQSCKCKPASNQRPESPAALQQHKRAWLTQGDVPCAARHLLHASAACASSPGKCRPQSCLWRQGDREEEIPTCLAADGSGGEVPRCIGDGVGWHSLFGDWLPILMAWSGRALDKALAGSGLPRRPHPCPFELLVCNPPLDVPALSQLCMSAVRSVAPSDPDAAGCR